MNCLHCELPMIKGQSRRRYCSENCYKAAKLIRQTAVRAGIYENEPVRKTEVRINIIGNHIPYESY
jgi:hypothetical protein